MALSWERPERIKMSERACGEREEKAELSSRSATSSRSKSASCGIADAEDEEDDEEGEEGGSGKVELIAGLPVQLKHAHGGSKRDGLCGSGAERCAGTFVGRVRAVEEGRKM